MTAYQAGATDQINEVCSSGQNQYSKLISPRLPSIWIQEPIRHIISSTQTASVKIFDSSKELKMATAFSNKPLKKVDSSKRIHIAAAGIKHLLAGCARTFAAMQCPAMSSMGYLRECGSPVKFNGRYVLYSSLLAVGYSNVLSCWNKESEKLGESIGQLADVTSLQLWISRRNLRIRKNCPFRFFFYLIF